MSTLKLYKKKKEKNFNILYGFHLSLRLKPRNGQPYILKALYRITKNRGGIKKCGVIHQYFI